MLDTFGPVSAAGGPVTYGVAMGGQTYDIVVVGGGHNGLVAAAYLARAGLSVLLLERLEQFGGAAVSVEPFAGSPARLSRYSYLVSLMPEQLMADLDLDVRLASRSTASFTPYVRGGRPGGLLVERPEGPATRESFRRLTGGEDEYAAWQAFYDEVGALARTVAPTLMRPLPRRRELADTVSGTVWRDVVERPLGEAIERRFADDTVRGVVATDALIGTFASLHDASLVQNRCFLYHLIGNGTGEWRVPVGGMGAVTRGLARAASNAGAELRSGAEVVAVRPGAGSVEVEWRDASGTHAVVASQVLSNVAPWVLDGLLGRSRSPLEKPQGAQLKINFLLDRLPRLRSGVDPEVAFAGTLHLSEDYSQLEVAYASAAEGRVPEALPGEVYCHSLSDDSILGPLAGAAHTLTYFGLHTPAALFDRDPSAKEVAVSRALASLNTHLAEPIEDCLARDASGQPCIEAKIPQDIEQDLAMPGGHIFHGDLSWPWLSDSAPADSPAQAWGVDTGVEGVLVCGSGATRGGAVSGLGGHNAAQAALASL